MGHSKRLILLLIAGIFLVPAALPAQDAQDQHNSSTPPANEKQQKQQEHKSFGKLEKELPTPYKKWLEEDVTYIITDEERHAFLQLATNEEREQFIEQFWLRRDPTPDTPENEFKEEHYRRIAYANEHFASGKPGWMTDRGRIYIIWGKPDEIESHPTGGQYTRPQDEGGGDTSTFPFEQWTYRHMDGIGDNIMLEFVDTTMTGEYHLTMDPGEKDALAHVANAGLSELEQMGISSKVDRFSRTDGSTAPLSASGMDPENQQEFTRLTTFAKVFQPPPVKFKDLDEIVSHRIVRDEIKFSYRFDFMRITSDTVLVPITVQIPNGQLSFQEKDGVHTATINLFAKVSTLTGRTVQTFEDVIRRDFPDSLLEQSLKGDSVYQKALPLSPGLYRLDIVLKDINSNNVGVVNARLAVPPYDDDKLDASTLILADMIQPVATNQIGVGQFVIGDLKVRPKLDQSFRADQPLGIYLQFYNFKMDDKTHKNDASIMIKVTQGDHEIARVVESGDQLNENGEQVTIHSLVPLSAFAPGQYHLEIQATDQITKQTISRSSDFTVKATPVGTSAQNAPGR
ncbi:MAG TPA: GWxTD domain-containing protein [Methylomirabilota bacterium]|jgi:GWxTD domain-containing protein|nr:GWxTD domain-containing protein [Methylomirabilota bacterium]